MEKEELKKQIQKLISDIKENAKDSAEIQTQLEQLLSLKGQYDIEAVEFVVPKKNVIREHDFGSTRIVECVNGIYFEAKGGMSTFIDMRMKGLYTEANGILNAYVHPDNDVTAEIRDNQVIAFTALLTVLQAPIYSAISEQMLIDVASSLMGSYNHHVQLLLEQAKKESEEANLAKLKQQAENEVKEQEIQDFVESAINNAPESF